MQHHALKLFLGLLYRSRNKKPLARSRERDVQQAHLLRQHLALQALLYRVSRKAGVFEPALEIIYLRAEAELRVDEHRLL